jgi:hypothetical protein
MSYSQQQTATQTNHHAHGAEANSAGGTTKNGKKIYGKMIKYSAIYKTGKRK